MTAHAELLEDHWFRAQGLDPAPVRRIHAEDDMFRFEGDLGREAIGLRATYMRTGFEACRVLEHALAKTGRSLSGSPSLLEFACGYGRVTRFLAQRVDPQRITSCDVLSSAVAYVQEHFGVQGLVSRTDPEEIELGGPYDVIFVASLFSHLPRHRFEQFLGLLSRALKPDGLLLFSTHGQKIVPEVTKDPSGFTFEPMSESAILDTAEYGATFVDPKLVTAIARAQGIAASAYLEREMWQHDLHFVSPSPLPALTADDRTPIARGSLQRADVDASGHGIVGGFVRVPSCHRLDRVELIFDGATAVEATLEPFAGDLPEVDGGSAFTQTTFVVGGPTGFLGSGTHTVVARAHFGDGSAWCFDVSELTVPEGIG